MTTFAIDEPMRFSLSDAFLSFPRSIGVSYLSLNLKNYSFQDMKTVAKLILQENDYYHFLSPSNSGQQKLNNAHNSCKEVIRLKAIKQDCIIKFKKSTYTILKYTYQRL